MEELPFASTFKSSADLHYDFMAIYLMCVCVHVSVFSF